MPRGAGSATKVHYKGKEEDFVVFVENGESVKKWKSDSSIALAQVVDSFTVFCTHKHGAQGVMDTASKATLENEFGTSVDDEVIKKILEQGVLQESEVSERQGQKNDSQGARVGH
ncbi:MAG: hypothetical protein MMC33_003031 [Icmadophila ericetorum]|nr:hypothetical protein [Icmadophila ericetorum]